MSRDPCSCSSRTVSRLAMASAPFASCRHGRSPRCCGMAEQLSQGTTEKLPAGIFGFVHGGGWKGGGSAKAFSNGVGALPSVLAGVALPDCYVPAPERVADFTDANVSVALREPT